MKKERILILDLLRIFAIGLVILAHIGQKLNAPYGAFVGIPNFYYVSLGGIGVTIFLILSGLVLEMNYGHKKYSYFNFIFHRARRIYVVYWLAIIFSLIFIAYEAGIPKNIWNIIWSFSGFQAFLGNPWSNYVISGGWFIGLIIYMYLLYPLLSKLLKLNNDYFLVFLLAISIIFRLSLGKWWPGWYRPQDWFPLCRVFEFGFGMWLANSRIINNLPSINVKLRQPIVTLSEISFPLYLVHIVLIPMIRPDFVSITFFIAFALLISYCIYLVDTILNKKIKNYSPAWWK